MIVTVMLNRKKRKTCTQVEEYIEEIKEKDKNSKEDEKQVRQKQADEVVTTT